MQGIFSIGESSYGLSMTMYDVALSPLTKSTIENPAHETYLSRAGLLVPLLRDYPAMPVCMPHHPESPSRMSCPHSQ